MCVERPSQPYRQPGTYRYIDRAWRLHISVAYILPLGQTPIATTVSGRKKFGLADGYLFEFVITVIWKRLYVINRHIWSVEHLVAGHTRQAFVPCRLFT